MKAKYLVLTGAILRFPDNTQVVLEPGVHSFEKHVIEHWAFGAHARPLEESDVESDTQSLELAEKVTSLEATITGLQQQVTEKDGTITGLQQQVTELTEKLDTLEAGNAKKQPSANK